MKYIIQMASDGMIHVPSFIKIGSGSNIKVIALIVWEPAVLVLLMGRIYDVHVRRWDGLRRYDIQTKFHDNWFRHSSDIKGITSAIWEAAVLALLIRGINYIRHWDGLRWHDIRTKIHDDLFRHSNYIKVITSTILEPAVLLLLSGRFMKYAFRWRHVAWYTYQVSWRLVQAVQAVLRFCLRNLRGCNVGITDGGDLWRTPLRLVQVPWYTYRVS
jgi:hypothetical protein